MSRRGDGIGIEVAGDEVRGVRLDHDEPGRLAGAAVEAVSGAGDDALVDAFVRLGAHLGASAETPVHLAWFPSEGRILGIDATGRPLAEVRDAMTVIAGVSATAVVDAGARRWALAIGWDHERSVRLTALAARAGLTVAVCEPAPLALARVLPTAPTLARRTDAGSAWDAVFVDGVPRAAAGGPPTGRRAGLTAVELTAGDLARLPDDAARDTDVARVVLDGLVDGRPRRTDPLALLLTGDPYPPYPADDVRSAPCQAVALGAAVGAAGLAGRVRAVEMLAAVGPTGAPDQRPWVVERLADEAPAAPTRVPWWRRLLDRLRRR